MAHDSQIVRTKENLNLSYVGRNTAIIQQEKQPLVSSARLERTQNSHVTTKL